MPTSLGYQRLAQQSATVFHPISMADIPDQLTNEIGRESKIQFSGTLSN
jgi:hypothetical protein